MKSKLGWICLACSALLSPAIAQEAPLPVDADPRIEIILAPLSSMPTLQRADEMLLVETELAASSNRANVEAWLIPSFGSVRPRIALGKPAAHAAHLDSRLWPGRKVDRLAYRLPDALLPDLYDLELGIAQTSPVGRTMGNDVQRRAVSILKDYPREPRVVVIADPSVGDPRPAQDAATDTVQRNEANQAAVLAQRSAGDPSNSERWAAFARTIREVNLARPDFVLVPGDLTFLTHPAATPYEYEDAWQLLNKLEVPAFLTPGNHDLYAIDEMGGTTPDENPASIDGRELWLKYFGPLYYAADVGPNLHIVSLNTFEWPRNDAFPIEDEFDTRAAGNIQAVQFSWLENDLRSFRARSAKGLIVTFAHHDPSWMQRRHAWTGERRLELRDLLAELKASVHFSGHTHEDRVARYYKGDVVETNGRPHVSGHVVKTLHLLKRDGSLDTTPTQTELGAILRDPTQGPLFVSTTSASSQLIGDIWGLGGYWGWRLAKLIPQAETSALDPIDMGYPITDAYLASRAERPEHWTAAHAQYGLFSYPSYELDQSIVTGNETDSPFTELQVTSRLLAALDIGTKLSLPAADGQAIEITGGEIQRIRYGGGVADVWVQSQVPASASKNVRIRHAKAVTGTPTGGTTGTPTGSTTGSTTGGGTGSTVGGGGSTGEDRGGGLGSGQRSGGLFSAAFSLLLAALFLLRKRS